jgi:hypothetical protein
MSELSFDKLLPLAKHVMVKALYSKLHLIVNYIYNLRFSACHVVGPDGPGFGFSGAPENGNFDCTFDHIAEQRQAAEVFGSGAVQGPFTPNAAEICP